MKATIGRGRGYTSRNRDKKPGNLNLSDENMQSIISTNNTVLSNVPVKSPSGSSLGLQSPQANNVGQPFGGSAAINKKFSPPMSLNVSKISHPSSQLPQVGFNQTSMTVPNKQSSNPATNNMTFQNFDDAENLDENIQSVLYIDEKYTYLIQQVNVLSNTDDGILTNQKLKYIEGVLTKECTQPHSLQSAMEAIASAAILDLNTATKVSKMMCSISFSRVQIHQLRLYNVFISAVRDKIDGLELSLDGADQYLVNSSTLLTGIYSESKLLEPEELNSLANLVVQVFVGLLECNTSLALRTLNVQLMQFGANLYCKVPEKLETISLMARRLLMGRQPPPIPSRIWLCLLCDQCIFEFQPLPKYLQSFYGTHIDNSNQESESKNNRHIGKVLKENTPVKITKSNKNYESSHKPSQFRVPTKSESTDRWSTGSNGDKGIHKIVHQDHSKDETFDEKHYFDDPSAEFYSSEASHDHLNDNNHSSQERKPRPILGAGARIAQQPKSDCEHQFAELQSHAAYNHSFSNESQLEIPDFCPSVPPPNFVPPPMSGKSITSVGQDSGDFWNYPPPKITSTNPKSSLASRLDLNSWRQQVNKDNEQFTTFESIEDKNGSSQKVRLNDENLIDSVECLQIGENKFENPEESVNQLEKNDTGVSFWGKKRPDEDEKNWSKSGKQKSIDWEKKDAEQKESNWRRRGSDEKNWDGKKNNWPNKKPNEGSVQDLTENRGMKPRTDSTSKTDEEDPGFDKRSGRRDSRGNGRGLKRDFMEVPRKASYWTHDDRCDRDYDE